MYCTKCGNKVKDDMRFCPQCGKETARPNCAMVNGSANKSRTACLFSLCASVLPFLMFFIPLQVTQGSIWGYFIIDGYDSFLQQDILSIWWGRGSSAISIVNIVVLCISFVLVILNTFATIKGTNNKTLHTISGFLCAFFSLLYCMEGIILVILCDSSYRPVTFSYFAIILAAFILIAQNVSKKSVR